MNLYRANGYSKIVDIIARYIEEGTLYKVIVEVNHFIARD